MWKRDQANRPYGLRLGMRFFKGRSSEVRSREPSGMTLHHQCLYDGRAEQLSSRPRIQLLARSSSRKKWQEWMKIVVTPEENDCSYAGCLRLRTEI